MQNLGYGFVMLPPQKIGNLMHPETGYFAQCLRLENQDFPVPEFFHRNIMLRALDEPVLC